MPWIKIITIVTITTTTTIIKTNKKCNKQWTLILPNKSEISKGFS